MTPQSGRSDSPPPIFLDPAALNRAAVIFRRALARPDDAAPDLKEAS